MFMGFCALTAAVMSTLWNTNQAVDYFLEGIIETLVKKIV